MAAVTGTGAVALAGRETTAAVGDLRGVEAGAGLEVSDRIIGRRAVTDRTRLPAMPEPGPFTDAERRAYVPPPCPDCGHQGDWREAAWKQSGDGLWLRGLLSCSNCGNRKGPEPFADLMP